MAAVLVLCGTAAWAADPGLMSLVMPDAVALAGINAAQVRTSPFGQYLFGQLKPDSPELQALMAATGFDPRRDVQEVLLASTQPLRPGQRPTGALLLVRGNFDVGRITQAAVAHKAALTQYDGVPLLSGPQAKGAVAFPDGTLAIAGEPAAVRAALDRRSSPAPLNPQLASAVQALSAAQDAWAVSEGPLVPAQAANPQMALLAKVEQVTWGIKFGPEVTLTGQATLPTAQDAAALAQAFQFMAGMGDIYLNDRYIKTPLLKNLKVTTDGNLAQASLAVPEATLEQLLAAHR